MANSIAQRKNYTTILDRVYQREACSACLDSPRSMVRAGRNAKEIMVLRISVTGLGDYTRNVGYKTGSIEFSYETKTFAYDRGIHLMADVMDVEEASVMDCFEQAFASGEWKSVGCARQAVKLNGAGIASDLTLRATFPAVWPTRTCR